MQSAMMDVLTPALHSHRLLALVLTKRAFSFAWEFETAPALSNNLMLPHTFDSFRNMAFKREPRIGACLLDLLTGLPLKQPQPDRTTGKFDLGKFGLIWGADGSWNAIRCQPFHNPKRFLMLGQKEAFILCFPCMRMMHVC